MFGAWPYRYKGGAILVQYTCDQGVAAIAAHVRQRLTEVLHSRADDPRALPSGRVARRRGKPVVQYDIHAHSMGGLVASLAIAIDPATGGRRASGSERIALPMPRASFFYDVPWAGLTPTLRMAVSGLADLAATDENEGSQNTADSESE